MGGQCKVSVIVAIPTYYQAPFLGSFGVTMKRKTECSGSGENNINHS